MRRTLFVSALAAAMGFYACKKEDKTVTVTETVHDTITNTIWLNGQVDPNELTTGITVRYGTAVSDSAFPATGANAPVLDTLYNKLYKVVEGQYLFIYPQALSGTVAGYYVKVRGAKSQFKVTYPAAPNPVRKKIVPANSLLARGADGYVDSAIVITLPQDIKGDTFSIQYVAFDNNNQVSAPVTARVYVYPQGTKAFNDSLAGTWTYYGSRQYSPNDDRGWIVDTLSTNSINFYTCSDNQLSTSDLQTDLEIVNIYDVLRASFTFNNYTAALSTSGGQRILDLENSSCTNLVYTYTGINDPEPVRGSYFYDAGVRRLAFVPNEQESNTAIQYLSMQVIELTAHRLVLGMNANDNSSATNMTMLQFYK